MLYSLNAAAQRAGLHIGQSHADARATRPELVSVPAEPAADSEALARLGAWCARWSPLVALDPPDGLLLDISGVAHLFGGEAGLIADLRRHFERAEFPMQMALADTPGAAWALARFTSGGITPAGGARDLLAPLPLAALRLGDDTLRRARRFGLRAVGDLYALPRAKLARRFPQNDGLTLVRRLDQALGDVAEPLILLNKLPRYSRREIYHDPLGDIAGIEARLPGLIEALAAALERDGRGARQLTLTACRVEGDSVMLSAGLGRPSRNTANWLRLLQDKGLDRIDPGFGIDSLILSAPTTESLPPEQAALDGQDDPDQELGELIDRLVARLGDEAVVVPHLHESWMPERAVRWRSGQRLAPANIGVCPGSRPILLLDRPEPVEALFVVPEGAPERFRWRRVMRRVVRAEGPERLSPEWWSPSRCKRRTRDYYRVEDENGVRFWLFREGLFDREDQERSPTWWLHGLFP